MVHGFSEHQSISFFEAALIYALNGFEVIMADMKSFGYSSGARAGGWVLEDH